jgi:hypothetical protein
MFGKKKTQQQTEQTKGSAIFRISEVNAELAVQSYLLFMDAYFQSYRSDDSSGIKKALDVARKSLCGYDELEVKALAEQIDPSYFTVIVSDRNIDYPEFAAFLGHMAVAASETELNGAVDWGSMQDLATMGGTLDISEIIRLNGPPEETASYGM